MNKGDLTSRELGKLAQEIPVEKSEGNARDPKQRKQQNDKHNSKKESLGPNTRQSTKQ